MDINKIVYLKHGYVLERIDGEITVYHPTLTTSVYLNETGAVIWELCDGTRTVADIIELLSEKYPESSNEVERDVKVLISQLIEKNIGVLG